MALNPGGESDPARILQTSSVYLLGPEIEHRDN